MTTRAAVANVHPLTHLLDQVRLERVAWLQRFEGKGSLLGDAQKQIEAERAAAKVHQQIPSGDDKQKEQPAAATAPTAAKEMHMSFFSKFEAEFKKLVGEAPKVEATIEATLTKTLPLVATLVGLTEGPVAAAAVTAIVTKIQTGLVVSSVVIQDAANDPTVPGLLADVTTNLGAIEAAAEIKNPATLAKLNSTVATITGEVAAIATALPVAAVA